MLFSVAKLRCTFALGPLISLQYGCKVEANLVQKSPIFDAYLFHFVRP